MGKMGWKRKNQLIDFVELSKSHFCQKWLKTQIGEGIDKMIPFVGLFLEIVQESVELPRIFRRHYWLELTSESLKDFGGQEMRDPFIMPTITDCRPAHPARARSIWSRC
jgi:hypothetical protein